MPDAVIVVANERGFAQRAKELKDYLRGKCRMHVVIDVPAWHRSPRELENPLIYRICAARFRPLLIAYLGHGAGPTKGVGDYGWGYGSEDGKNLIFPYSKLVTLLQRREGPTLILNDCCYAGALESEFDVRRPTDKPVGIISASPKKGFAYGDLVPTVIESWERRETYVPKIRPRFDTRKHRVLESRYGEVLDRYFFPREP